MAGVQLGLIGSLFGAVPGSFESIATVTVGVGGASSITFASIPQTYTHLQIRGIGRTTRASSDDSLKITLNSDTTYAYHYLLGDGASVSAGAGTSGTSFLQVGLPGDSGLANVFSAMMLDILDYTSVNKAKTVRTIAGYDENGNGIVGLSSGLDYATPTAITSINLSSWNGANFKQYSQFALFGLKG